MPVTENGKLHHVERFTQTMLLTTNKTLGVNAAEVASKRYARKTEAGQPTEDWGAIVERVDHLKAVRLDLVLTQEQAAQEMGVNQETVHNWERSHTTPAVQFIPRIIEFVGYDPSPAGNCLQERLRARRLASAS